jgi:hypothetical protein
VLRIRRSACILRRSLHLLLRRGRESARRSKPNLRLPHRLPFASIIVVIAAGRLGVGRRLVAGQALAQRGVLRAQALHLLVLRRERSGMVLQVRLREA